MQAASHAHPHMHTHTRTPHGALIPPPPQLSYTTTSSRPACAHLDSAAVPWAAVGTEPEPEPEPPKSSAPRPGTLASAGGWALGVGRPHTYTTHAGAVLLGHGAARLPRASSATTELSSQSAMFGGWGPSPCLAPTFAYLHKGQRTPHGHGHSARSTPSRRHAAPPHLESPALCRRRHCRCGCRRCRRRHW